MKKILISTGLILFITVIASGGTLKLTVEDAVEMAMKNNLSLQREGINLKINKRSKDSRWNTFLPGINASASFTGTNQIFTDQTTLPEWDEDSRFGLNAGFGISLPLNASMITQMKKSVADYEAGLLSYESARKDLERNVRKQFYMLLASRENISLQESNIALAENRLNQARENFANGLAPELTVLSAEVTVANLQPEYDRAEANLKRLSLFFKFLIGAEPDDEIVLEGSLDTKPIDLNAQELIAKHLQNRTDLRTLNKQIESLEYAKLSAILGTKTPSLILGYNYKYSGSKNYIKYTPAASLKTEWGDWLDNGTFSIALNWKLDSLIPGSREYVSCKNINDNIESAQKAKTMMQEKAEIEITNIINNIAVAQKTIEASTSTVKLAQRTVELTEEAYRAGAKEILDVESAQNNVMKASLQLLMARYSYIESILDLEYELNTSIKNF